ncbi:MAG TPA: hypothetical protein VNM68_09210, partial [Candidatus Polarisedimenticolia bacterium]|nr:hypothetical protein [Candidatus Polarisedimenticolia bacterium]
FRFLAVCLRKLRRLRALWLLRRHLRRLLPMWCNVLLLRLPLQRHPGQRVVRQQSRNSLRGPA